MKTETKRRSAASSTMADRYQRMQGTLFSRVWSVILTMATVILISSAARAQDLTFYNGLNCKISVKITYSNSSCPGSNPTYTQCTDLNSPGTTSVPLPTGWSKVISIEYHCGWGCTSWQTTYSCNGTYNPALPFTCCGRNITVQGALDPGEFRIDVQ